MPFRAHAYNKKNEDTATAEEVLNRHLMKQQAIMNPHRYAMSRAQPLKELDDRGIEPQAGQRHKHTITGIPNRPRED